MVMVIVMVVTQTAGMALTVAQMPERTLEQMLELKQAETRRRRVVPMLLLTLQRKRRRSAPEV